MALRDQPYIPLYIQDFLTDEKLIECSAQATGVYVRLMCIMHKSEEYGKILLKQKDKQTNEQTKNFASKLAKQMPYSFDVVESSLVELLAEKVLFIDGDFLCQKRMIKDNSISLVRSRAGKKGGEFAQAKIKAKPLANSENEIVIENEIETVIKKPVPKNEIFEEIFTDEIYMDQISVTHKGKDIKQAWEECYTHHSNAPNPPREIWEWKQKLNTWLSIKGKENGKANGINKKQQSDDAITASVAEHYRTKIAGK